MEYPLPPIDQVKPSWSDRGNVYKVVYGLTNGNIKATFCLNILGMVLSTNVIMAVAWLIRRPQFKGRPSFRLSATIAFYNIVCMISAVVLYHPEATEGISEIRLRTILWFRTFGVAGFVLTIVMIAVHLHLTVILDKHRLAKRLNPYFEVIVLILSIIISQPEFYIHDGVERHPDGNVIINIDNSWGSMRFQLFMMYSWILLGIVYCTVICCMVVLKLVTVWRRVKDTTPNFPEGLATSANNGGSYRANTNLTMASLTGNAEDRASMIMASYPYRISTSANPVPIPITTSPSMKPQVGNQPPLPLYSPGKLNISIHQATSPYQPNDDPRPMDAQAQQDQINAYLSKEKSERKQRILLAILRIALNPITPLLVTPIVPIYMCVGNPSVGLQRVYLYIPFINVVTNTLIFLANPCFDNFWKKFYRNTFMATSPIRRKLRKVFTPSMWFSSYKARKYTAKRASRYNQDSHNFVHRDHPSPQPLPSSLDYDMDRLQDTNRVLI
ncbi:hypothetical protein H4219_002644 [Mycoemilia scoparia]|uniref:Uncharacterized protein n=1 Tax=Mycoemilia scoparia TaxID=417184 RepID=A0A9W8DU37_9FUNG|nr:hypothetical protein H4219_002644 [Mycoemilia scoparia]